MSRFEYHLNKLQNTIFLIKHCLILSPFLKIYCSTFSTNGTLLNLTYKITKGKVGCYMTEQNNQKLPFPYMKIESYQLIHYENTPL